MAEYSKIARGSFLSMGLPQVIQLPFQPTVVRMTNHTAYGSFDASEIPWASWDISIGQGRADIGYVLTGTPNVLQIGVVSSGGISTFSKGLALQFGAKTPLASIDKGTGIFTTVNPHGFASGDVVIFQGLYESPTTGMPQICGMPFEITVESSTTFTSGWDINQSNFTSLSGSPAGASVTKVLNPYLYVPGVNFIEDLSVSRTALTVTTTTPHCFVVGQEVAFRIPAAYGSVELNSLPNTAIPGSPIYGYVQAITPNTFDVSLVPFGGSITAFNSNQPVSSVPGLQFPQVIAVGDVNTGGFPFTGGALYPSPNFATDFTTFSTINGPAIQGAFVNNTSQGFIIGNGHAVISGSADTSSFLCGDEDDLIYWEAMFTDIGS